jgi:hypothetical protein
MVSFSFALPAYPNSVAPGLPALRLRRLADLKPG